VSFDFSVIKVDISANVKTIFSNITLFVISEAELRKYSKRIPIYLSSNIVFPGIVTTDFQKIFYQSQVSLR
jgi:hypothetical protein